MSQPEITRRKFLGDAAALTAAGAAAAVSHTAGAAFAATQAGMVAPFTILPSHVLGRRQTPPSEKLNIAGIGVGGMGHHNLNQLEPENIVALCDVDPNYAARSFKKYPDAKVWTDYRKMLEQQKDIDAVLIATPDHTHAVIAKAALEAGKHVYLQKPLTHDVYEARFLARLAHEHPKLVTQMGIQGHSDEGVRLLCEWLWDGAIGDVHEVEVWCNDSYYPWGHEGWSPASPDRPKDTPTPPEGMDWDLWLGPAPQRPYHPVYHPMRWRAWWDFGSGWMADRGAHQIDPAVWALKLGLPTVIEATQLGQTDEVHSIGAIVSFYFPARRHGDPLRIGGIDYGLPGGLNYGPAGSANGAARALPPVKLTWYEGVRAPRPSDLDPELRMGDGDGGAIFHGTKGKLICGTYGNSPRILPESLMKEYNRPENRPEKTIPRVGTNHEQNWVAACKSGRPAVAPFAYGALVTEICLLGVIARRMDDREGKHSRLEWDADSMKITNVPAANGYVRRAYREGWELA
ncbi:MAG: Gfo/Idh/MocA family oxidoreductase [Planctomycetota bacterium]